MKKETFERLENMYNKLINKGAKRITANKLFIQFLFENSGTVDMNDVVLFLNSKRKKDNNDLYYINIMDIHRKGCVYASGGIFEGKKRVGDYFKLDKITEDIKPFIYGKITLGKTYKQYSPGKITNTIFFYY